MRIDILTLLPALLEGPFSDSIMKRAQEKGHVEIHIHNIRDYSTKKHKNVDDYQYGGVITSYSIHYTKLYEMINIPRHFYRKESIVRIWIYYYFLLNISDFINSQIKPHRKIIAVVISEISFKNFHIGSSH